MAPCMSIASQEPRLMRDIELFDYDPITRREPIAWPGGARVAFYVGLNVEHFYADAPSTSLVT